jgi:hypothetical protein
MLPEISLIQKCPKCGKYYFRTRQEAVFSDDDDWGSDSGVLTFPEMKEAFMQLSEEGFVDANEERSARMMLHHAFNDYYYRNNSDGKPVNDDDWSIFKENALWIIEHVITDGVLKAEYYREIGMMEEALSVLQNLTLTNEFVKKVAEEVAKRIKKNDRKVFLIR